MDVQSSMGHNDFHTISIPVGSENRIICGDSLEVLKTHPSEVFDCCVTSPPYWGLRDYGITNQIGAEEKLEDYIDNLVTSPLRSASQPSTLNPVLFSVIICTRNGRDRIGSCLGAVSRLAGGISKPSSSMTDRSDGTADFVAENFPAVRLLRLDTLRFERGAQCRSGGRQRRNPRLHR